MTPFMIRVADAVGGGERADRPDVRPSDARPTGFGADEQVMTRALAEQLVSEANAVLGRRGQGIELRDELVAGQLSFVLRYGSRSAQVATSFADGTSTGRLRGVGARCQGEVALDGSEQLERLILLLIAEPAAAH